MPRPRSLGPAPTPPAVSRAAVQPVMVGRCSVDLQYRYQRRAATLCGNLHLHVDLQRRGRQRQFLGAGHRGTALGLRLRNPRTHHRGLGDARGHRDQRGGFPVRGLHDLQQQQSHRRHRGQLRNDFHSGGSGRHRDRDRQRLDRISGGLDDRLRRGELQWPHKSLVARGASRYKPAWAATFKKPRSPEACCSSRPLGSWGSTSTQDSWLYHYQAFRLRGTRGRCVTVAGGQPGMCIRPA